MACSSLGYFRLANRTRWRALHQRHQRSISMPMARLILSVSLRGIDVVSHGSSVFGARIANGGTDLPSASQPGISYSDSLFAQLAKSDAPAVPREYLAEVRGRAYLVVSL